MAIGAKGSRHAMGRQQVPYLSAVVERYELSDPKFSCRGLPPAKRSRADLDLKPVGEEWGEFGGNGGLSKVMIRDYLAPRQLAIDDRDFCFQPLTAAPAEHMDWHRIEQLVGEQDS